jgi:hypothetical protein
MLGEGAAARPLAGDRSDRPLMESPMQFAQRDLHPGDRGHIGAAGNVRMQNLGAAAACRDAARPQADSTLPGVSA